MKPGADALGRLARDRDEILVAQLDGAVGRGLAGRGDVAAPGPGGAARVADLLELVAPLGLDPEARVRAVSGSGVVPAVAAGAQPAPLEQRADDVAAVAHDVERRRHPDRPPARRRRRSSSPASARRRGDAGRRRTGGSGRGSGGRRSPARRRGRSTRPGSAAFSGFTSPRSTRPGCSPSVPRGEGRPGSRRADDEDEPVVVAEQRALPRAAHGDAHGRWAVRRHRPDLPDGMHETACLVHRTTNYARPDVSRT